MKDFTFHIWFPSSLETEILKFSTKEKSCSKKARFGSPKLFHFNFDFLELQKFTNEDSF